MIILFVLQETPANSETIESTVAITAAYSTNGNIPSYSINSTIDTNAKSEIELTLIKTEHNSIRQDSIPVDTHSTSKLERTADVQSIYTPERTADNTTNSTPERTADINSDSVLQRIADSKDNSTPDINSFKEQNKSNTEQHECTSSSHTTEDTHADNSITDATSSVIVPTSVSAVAPHQIPAETADTDPSAEILSPRKVPQSADSYTPCLDEHTEDTKYSHVTADTDPSAVEILSPRKVPQSADNYTPCLDEYTEDSKYSHVTADTDPSAVEILSPRKVPQSADNYTPCLDEHTEDTKYSHVTADTDPSAVEILSPRKVPQSADSYTPCLDEYTNDTKYSHIIAETPETDPSILISQPADNYTQDTSKYSHVINDTTNANPSVFISQSTGETHSPCKTKSADIHSPSLEQYTQDSRIYSDDTYPQYRTTHTSPRRDLNPRETTTTTTSERSRIFKEQYTSARAKSATDKTARKSRISGLKSHSLNELLPAVPADKEQCFSRYETEVSRIDSLFRLLIKYLLSLDVSFPLLHSWTHFYQILSPERSPRHSPDTSIIRDLEIGWDGTSLFLELTRDCLSKIRSDSPRLRSRAGERLNKLLTFQILVLVARETVPSADMCEMVRHFGTEEVCAELMSVPLILSEGLCKEQLMAVFLSHELFSLLTNCSRIEWGGRVRKKLDVITHLVTRSLPQRRPSPSASSLLIAFYPLANSLIQEGFLKLEGLDLDAFIELNSRTLLSSLPPSPPFSPYVTTGYLDQVFIFLNHTLKQPRRHKTQLRILSFASSLFSQNCVRHVSGGSSAPLGELLHPSLSPIALMEFLTLLRDCLLRLSRDSSSLLLLSCELLKELFLSVSALLSASTMDRLLDWYTQWLFLDYYTELVGLCVTGLSDLQECCVERGLHQWVTQRLLTSDLVPSLLRVAQFLLVTHPDSDAFLPLLFLLSFCADTADTLSRLAATLQLPQWSEVSYALFSHLLEEPRRERELQLLLSLFLRIASLYKQRGEQLVPYVLTLVSDKHSSDLNRFYQLLAHENREVALSVYKLVRMLIEQSQDSTISEGLASQQDLINAFVKLLSPPDC